MVEQLEGLWTLISLLIKTNSLLHALRKALPLMALCSNASATPQSPLLWKPPVLASKKARDASRSPRKDENLTFESFAERPVAAKAECKGTGRELKAASEVAVGRKLRKRPAMIAIPQNAGGAGEALFRKDEEVGSEMGAGGELKAAPAVAVGRKLRKRPAMIAIPQGSSGEVFFRKDEDVGRDMVVEGNGYCMASRRGTRHMMEDGYGVMTGIHGDSKQAFFGVYDGHGGRAAVDFVSEKLGKNIIRAIEELNEEGEGDGIESAIKASFLTTDSEFLSQGVNSGVCAATVLLKNEELHVANAGDCRVVMSRKGVADALTSDHRAGRQDERIRIENLGGYVSCHNGVWRVQETLAISRAIGDASMKEWIISEPEIKRLQLTHDCQFLIIASDGLWDKVGNQEAVDVVMKRRNSMQSCKDLMEISCNRGNRDDITVMIVDLQNFFNLSNQVLG